LLYRRKKKRIYDSVSVFALLQTQKKKLIDLWLCMCSARPQKKVDQSMTLHQFCSAAGKKKSLIYDFVVVLLYRRKKLTDL
jgi:hypothetical protein